MQRTLALILLAWSIPGIAAAQWNVASDPFPTISTSATSEVKVAPDQVYLSLGVTVRNNELEAANAESDRRVAAVLKSLRENGVADKDMQTDYINIQPVYENAKTATPDVYVVARSIGVRVRNIDSFEKILTDALNDGANQVGGIDFRTSELQKHRDEARKLAVNAAREKAQTLAQQLGVKVGAVHSITENVSNSYLGALNGCFAGNAVLNYADSSLSSDTLATGQINVTATVNLKFRLE